MAIAAIAPCAAAAFYFYGWRVILMIIVSYAAGGAVEILFACIRKEPVAEGFLVTGLIFPLILPPATPLWMVAVGVAFGVFMGKEIFGGTGRNLFNAALVGRCFLFVGYPAAIAAAWRAPGTGWFGRIPDFNFAIDGVTAATPLVQMKNGIPVSMWDLFIGRCGGCIGETSALLILIGGVALCLIKVASWRTVAGVVGTYAVLGQILHMMQPATFPPVVLHMLAGGFLFGAFFMATDPVTSPSTKAGKWMYGFIIGLSALLIRNLTGYVEGMMFAILLGNIAAPLLDDVVNRIRLKRLQYERKAI